MVLMMKRSVMRRPMGCVLGRGATFFQVGEAREEVEARYDADIQGFLKARKLKAKTLQPTSWILRSDQPLGGEQ